MFRIIAALALATLMTGPVLAQGTDIAGSSAKTTVRRDSAKSDYWASRDLSSILTRVVTIKVR